jgi:hypothetical protein
LSPTMQKYLSSLTNIDNFWISNFVKNG